MNESNKKRVFLIFLQTQLTKDIFIIRLLYHFYINNRGLLRPITALLDLLLVMILKANQDQVRYKETNKKCKKMIKFLSFL